MTTENKEFLERNGFREINRNDNEYEYILDSESESPFFISIWYSKDRDIFSIFWDDKENMPTTVEPLYQGSLEKFQLLVDCYKTYFQ
jgi:hypothetical protein